MRWDGYVAHMGMCNTRFWLESLEGTHHSEQLSRMKGLCMAMNHWGPQNTENDSTTSVSISFLRLLLHGVVLKVLAYLLLYETQKWWHIQVTQRDANGHIC